MALETVGHVVAALLDSYGAALECYAGWRRRQRARNHYYYRTTTTSTATNDGNTKGDTKSGKETTFSAAGTSLSISKLKIEEAFQSGVDVLGDEFVYGDAALQRAIEGGEYYPLPLGEVTRVSEAMRISTLAALQKQYQRLVVGRLAPRAVSPPQNISISGNASHVDDTASHEPGVDPATPTQVPDHHLMKSSVDKDSNSTVSNSNNNPREPPSPPTTPTQISKEPSLNQESESTYSWSTARFGDARPKNSVFSVFCPEAMKYQVDLEKALPIDGARCRCGYVWNAGCRAEDRATMVIKDGFHITPRFLGKSHCNNGLGCVLCTSNGRIETFGSVEGLRTHINSSHSKWQLLHDRDLAGH
ncbi:hypothetical protein F5B22DRAFT_648136 [Xylaria bambusicola]|uniref:uncharacterized protein n=1 Tax=Xylaria bambusicola TaxID=326684 RepID=UPI0020087442|nr:uncharacterized protein F5B22DRAFT_648136 [Xylaria bambusicola]KAI0513042.1 hypothetical protein F5B22DRAFT_648136 [Xylaria bambusicola]